MPRQINTEEYQGPNRRAPDFSKAVIGAVVGAVLAVGSWVGSELYNGGRTDQRLTTSMEFMLGQVRELSADMKDLRTALASGLNDSYRKSDAERDFRPRDARLDRHAQQLADHEQRLRDVERHAGSSSAGR